METSTLKTITRKSSTPISNSNSKKTKTNNVHEMADQPESENPKAAEKEAVAEEQDSSVDMEVEEPTTIIATPPPGSPPPPPADKPPPPPPPLPAQTKKKTDKKTEKKSRHIPTVREIIDDPITQLASEYWASIGDGETAPLKPYDR